MIRRRQIKGVLVNFLGTFTSRYSEFDGYWLFGFLVDGMDNENIDLLGECTDSLEDTPADFTKRLAVWKFAEQVAKAGIEGSWLREARLDITRLATPRLGYVNNHSCLGYDIRFLVRAVTDLGRTFDTTLSVFVAPHDPRFERRSLK